MRTPLVMGARGKRAASNVLDLGRVVDFLPVVAVLWGGMNASAVYNRISCGALQMAVAWTMAASAQGCMSPPV